MKKRIGDHVLFGVSLAALLALGGWWAMYFERSIELERDVRWRELRAAATVHALRLGHAAGPLQTGPIEGAEPLEVAPQAAAGQVVREHDLWLPTVPYHPRLGVQPTAQALAALERKFLRRRLMVWGESGLLVFLISVCVFMLYRMVRRERDHMQRWDRFLSAVTHEMKTPLAGIKSMLQTFVAGRVPPEQGSRLFGLALKESERLEHLVENVLIAGRLRADAYETHIEPVAVRGLLEQFVEHRRSYLVDQPEALRLVWEPERDEVEVSADAAAIRVILENLTDNAFKYGGAQPAVVLRARQVPPGFEISVEDGGVGFRPEQAGELFEPFRRAVDQRTAARHGTGLGLSIARSLAQTMGGELSASSAGPDRGSCFTLRLAEVAS